MITIHSMILIDLDKSAVVKAGRSTCDDVVTGASSTGDLKQVALDICSRVADNATSKAPGLFYLQTTQSWQNKLLQ